MVLVVEWHLTQTHTGHLPCWSKSPADQAFASSQQPRSAWRNDKYTRTMSTSIHRSARYSSEIMCVFLTVLRSLVRTPASTTSTDIRRSPGLFVNEVIYLLFSCVSIRRYLSWTIWRGQQHHIQHQTDKHASTKSNFTFFFLSLFRPMNDTFHQSPHTHATQNPNSLFDYTNLCASGI